jgi:hypothetical protein
MREPHPGLICVEYHTPEDLQVSAQQALLQRLEEKRGRVVIVFDVGPAVRSVPMDVPTYWLGVTARRELQLVGMAIVTNSSAVRVAAQGFALANLARRIATKVSTFKNVPAAEAWGLEVLSAANAAA